MLDILAIFLVFLTGFGFIVSGHRGWPLVVGGLLVLTATALFALRYSLL